MNSNNYYVSLKYNFNHVKNESHSHFGFIMFFNNDFFDDIDAQRLSVGIAAAIALHILILVWLTLPNARHIVSAETFSAPTNVSIRFVTQLQKTEPIEIEKPPEPVKITPEPVIKKVAKKTVKRLPPPEKLNKIEPAATSQPKIQPKAAQQKPVKATATIPDVIPVISETMTKGRRVQPKYPKKALRMRQEGVVLLHVLISESGERQKIKLHKPSQYSLLNKAAIKAVKKWTFDPNIINGRAIQSWVEIPIEFKIQ